MQNIQPDNMDSMPLRQSTHSMSTIVIRFVGLLTFAVVAMDADLEPLNFFSAHGCPIRNYWRTNAVSSIV